MNNSPRHFFYTKRAKITISWIKNVNAIAKISSFSVSIGFTASSTPIKSEISLTKAIIFE